MLTDEQTETLLTNIAELGGKALKEEDIVYEGQKLVIPEQFKGQLEKAVEFLLSKSKEESDEANFARTFNYRPYDGAVCAFRALKQAFGLVQGKATWSWLFGKQPPKYIQVAVSATETEECPWGTFTVPVIEGTTFVFGSVKHKELGNVFQISVTAPRRQRFIVEGIFRLVEEELKKSSIYKGKAIDGQENPNFLDLRGLDTSKIVYSDQVFADLEAHIWSVIRYPETYRQLGMPLKRAVLLIGPYGTGKSLAGYLTALETQDKGWTFLMARPGRDNFGQVMQTARLYMPAVVFFEDAETVAGAGDKDSVSEILDVMDGIQSKTTELVVVMTTNHAEEIHKGMHRPGRVDAQIEIGELDANGIQKLIRAQIPADMLASDIDWPAVVKANEGYVPAFVKEGADRSIRYALPRNEGSLKGLVIGTEELVFAATGMRPQFERMQDAPETGDGEKPLRVLVEEAVQSAVAEMAAPIDHVGTDSDVWNREKLEELQEAR